ncbi:glutamate-5-semialdehyde dehydrogenase [Anaerobacillus arseniciselenatis]|uniref:Gamma-glutamyl phosphate reductase n=1 Tax=Anaerobacillus arseniciselenatis TaxID=85682 RepID=A0A1S2LX78_9BACI|nr:glutamate-5-semialdehyde dehydrogenase [Anaerobacillus arseniciselenatis]OIJ15975.1 glutamate-5-semialdehyde dehydrogenase [Anaerobacillus arseniciselenatis]
MNELVTKAKKASEITAKLGATSTEEKNEALKLMSEKLMNEIDYLLKENEKDIEAGRSNGLSDGLLDRLRLTETRIKDMATALLQLIELPDPIGEVTFETERPNGLELKKIRVPLGVIGMIYEARPNVTVDAASLCLKTGNAVLLRGSSSAIHSNKALVNVIHRALEKSSLPKEAVQLIEDTKRETAEQMFKLTEYLDVLIPRGGAKLIQSVVEKASVPVLETGVGNCHVYIDDTANEQMAVDIVVNAKTQRPSVCNACETVIVHQDWAKFHFTSLVDALVDQGVELRGDDAARKLDARISVATEEDWQVEFLNLTLAVKVVNCLEEAIEHIGNYGSKHTEAIISETEKNVNQFFTFVDAAALYHNASTRFTDGFEFGFGAEIGISTQKLHARGPMGLEALTSSKYIILGTGQIRS